MKKWYLKKYEDGDELDIINLRKAVFYNDEPEKQEIAYWKWQFQDNPAGHADIAMAYDTGENIIIGHHATMPCKFKINNKDALVGFSCDAMTRENFRYPFMYMNIRKTVESDLLHVKYDFNYGYAYREKTIGIVKRLNRFIPFEIPVLVKPIFFSKILNKYIKSKMVCNIISLPMRLYNLVNKLKTYRTYDDIQIDNIDKFGEDIDKLWDICKSNYNIIQCRNSHFLNWKYVHNPYRNYYKFKSIRNNNVTGYMVARETELYGLKCMIIADLLVTDKESLYMLEKKIYSIAVQNDCALIGTIVSPTSSYYKIFKQLYYIKSPYKFTVHTNDVEDEYKKMMRQSNGLYLTWYDTDTM